MTGKQRLAAAVLATMSLLSLGGTALPAEAAEEEVFTVYLAPGGSDSADGRTPETAVRTLGRVQAVLVAAAPETDVEVRIQQGTYVAAQVVWRYHVHGRRISFLPIDYDEGDGIGDIAGRPVFRGDGSAGYWFTARLPSGHPGGATNLRFAYLQVEDYSSGGLQFHGGINTWNSSGNRIENNHFVSNENAGADAGLIHGVYLAHHSQRNVIRGNRFTDISGGPMRTRNDSNGNDIYGNRFERAGTGAYYSEWFCDTQCVAANPGHARECASHGNVFHENALISGYDGGDLPVWALTPPGIDYPGGTGCTNEGQPRVRTWGNTV